MRTLQRIVTVAVRKALGLNGRPYRVGGAISFALTPGVTFDDRQEESKTTLEAMRKAIQEVDKDFPWKDEGGADSIGYLSDGEVVVHNFHVKETICWFSLAPGVNCVSKGQVHAYEKYLSKLAFELAKKGLPDVSIVRCRVDIFRTYEYSSWEDQ